MKGPQKDSGSRSGNFCDSEIEHREERNRHTQTSEKQLRQASVFWECCGHLRLQALVCWRQSEHGRRWLITEHQLSGTLWGLLSFCSLQLPMPVTYCFRTLLTAMQYRLQEWVGILKSNTEKLMQDLMAFSYLRFRKQPKHKKRRSRYAPGGRIQKSEKDTTGFSSSLPSLLDKQQAHR